MVSVSQNHLISDCRELDSQLWCSSVSFLDPKPSPDPPSDLLRGNRSCDFLFLRHERPALIISISCLLYIFLCKHITNVARSTCQ